MTYDEYFGEDQDDIDRATLDKELAIEREIDEEIERRRGAALRSNRYSPWFIEPGDNEN